MTNATAAFASPSPAAHRERRWLLWTLTALVVVAGGVGLLLRFGGSLLIVSDPLPAHSQVAVVLAGSPRDDPVRRDAALSLLRAQRVDNVLLSVPTMTYWDVPVAELARRYVENLQPPELRERVTLCAVGSDVDSTAEEAAALRSFLESRGWRSVVVVTSDYHTRRARMVWRAALAHAQPPFRLSVEGAASREFEPRGWWRNRLWAKTWLLEFTKLVWMSTFGWAFWK